MAAATSRAWQRMLSGRRLDILDPSPIDVELSDIAHGLARVARWNGQTSGDYAFSVAQHSVVVMAIFCALNPNAPNASILQALLHDAPEYVMGDIISPFKAAMGGNYREVEQRLLGAIHLRFGLSANPPATLTKRIKNADREAAYLEAVTLAGFGEAEARRWFGKPRLASFDRDAIVQLLRPWPAPEANARFIAEFEKLAQR